jgi:hypothetical protein
LGTSTDFTGCAEFIEVVLPAVPLATGRYFGIGLTIALCTSYYKMPHQTCTPSPKGLWPCGGRQVVIPPFLDSVMSIHHLLHTRRPNHTSQQFTSMQSGGLTADHCRTGKIGLKNTDEVWLPF